MSAQLPNTLQVLLGNTPVGVLELESGGLDQSRFRFLPAYRDLARRPVLGQTFIDRLDGTWTARVRVPAFFSNLLPEGALRELLAQRAGVSAAREFFLLAELGEDLPGNVVVRPLGSLNALSDLSEELPAPIQNEEPLRFSVAGLQLKFSVNRKNDRWTLPFRGQGGRWYLKLPSQRFRRVPRNEFWMMSFAKRLGLDVAEVQLVPWEGIEGLTSIHELDALKGEAEALLVRRFDRTEDNRRIHVEDFLQVLDKFPDQRTKYRAGNYDQFGRLMRALIGDDVIDEYVSRLVFNAALGNGDAHLKNWMFRYPDEITASLAPAFDLVSTIQYAETDQHEFALNFATIKRYDQFDREAILRFAKSLDVPGRPPLDGLHLVEVAEAFASRVRSEWSAFAEEHSSVEMSARLFEHWKRIPLMQ